MILLARPTASEIASVSLPSFLSFLRSGATMRYDQPHLMAQRPQLPSPPVGTAVGFHLNQTEPELREERTQVRPRHLTAQDGVPALVDPV